MTVDLHHTEAGTGTPLVLLHGFALSSGMWSAQRDGLADACRVITPDQRGFGGSPLGDDEPSLEHAVGDLAALLDRLGLDRVVLGGLSMGGYVVMRFLARYPERVAAVVLADTKAVADIPEAKERRERIARRVVEPGGIEVLYREFVPTIVGRSTKQHRPEVVERVRELIAKQPVEGIAWASRAMGVRPDSTDVLAGTRVPALVIVGDEDELTPPAEAQAMAAVLPRAELVRIPGAGHLSAVEDPAAFTAAVREFVTRVG
jgi:pimeloyl-ACP methyl ester carboxylesterase